MYCRELCDYFLARGFFVTVATEVQHLQQYSLLDALADHPKVRFIPDTWTCETRVSSQLRGLAAAARESGSDVTFLAEADLALGLIAAQITQPGRRLPGRRVGLFLRSTNYVHNHADIDIGRLGRAVLTAYRYRPVSVTQPRIFHEIIVRRLGVLDAALCLDEVFVSEHGERHAWLPDIAVASSGPAADGAEAAAWGGCVSKFAADRAGRPLVVYVGTPSERRGYDALLQLARDVGGSFVHCGAPDDSCGYPPEHLEARSALVEASAILESGYAYRSFETARATFAAAKCVVLPYVGHLGSSGVMLQALMAGRPVLVPDKGLMGCRVRRFGLGLTFFPGDRRDMRHKFAVLESTPTEVFADGINRFLAYFSRTRFEAAVDAALGIRQRTARLPSTKASSWPAAAARRLP